MDARRREITSAITSARSSRDGDVLALAFALAPAAMLGATWTGQAAAQPGLFKQIALPVVIAEILVVAIGFARGLRPRLPRLAALPLGLLVLIACLTAFLAPQAPRSLLWTGLWLIHLLFGFAAFHLLGARQLTIALMTGFVVFLAAFAIAALTGPVANWVENPPGFDQVRRLGYYSAAIAGLCIGAFAAPATRGERRAVFVVACLAFALAFWSGTRGALLSAAFGGAAAALILPPLRRWRVAGMTLASAALGMVAALAVPVPAPFMGVLRVFFPGGGEGGLTSGRTEIWRLTATRIAERPWFGWGEAQTPLFAPVMQPHNLLLQTLLAWGVVGTACLFLLGVLLARRARARLNGNADLLPPATAALVLLAYAMIDGTLYHVHAVSLFAACVAVAAAGRPAGMPARP